MHTISPKTFLFASGCVLQELETAALQVITATKEIQALLDKKTADLESSRAEYEAKKNEVGSHPITRSCSYC